MNRSISLRLFKILAILVFILAVVSYAIWRSLNYVRGPEIVVASPENGTSLNENTALVIGKALRIEDLRLNGKQIQVDEQGNFNERIVVFPGLNIVTVNGSDQFDRKTQVKLQFWGAAQFPVQEHKTASGSQPVL